MRACLLVVLALLASGCAAPASRPPMPDEAAPPPDEGEGGLGIVPPPPRELRPDDPRVCQDRWPCVPFDGGDVPRFATALHIDLADVTAVTRFRSGFGHDHSMGTDESCRSLKHYFLPRLHLAGEDVVIASPTRGTLVSAEREHSGMGAQVWIQPEGHPEFRVILFHVILDEGLENGTLVEAGGRLGHHYGNQTANDIAILVLTPEGPRFLPYPDVLTDEAWQPFADRGIQRQDLIIERAWRDANPMQCDGERFVGGDTTRDVLPLG